MLQLKIRSSAWANRLIEDKFHYIFQQLVYFLPSPKCAARLTVFMVLLAKPRIVLCLVLDFLRAFMPAPVMSAAPDLKANTWQMCSGYRISTSLFRKFSTSWSWTSSSKAILISWAVLDRSWSPSLTWNANSCLRFPHWPKRFQRCVFMFLTCCSSSIR